MLTKDTKVKIVMHWKDEDGVQIPVAELDNVDLETVDKVLSELEYVRVVRCKDCIHKPYVVDVFHASYGDIPVLDSNGKCPCINADDYFYSHMPDDDWFCASGERRKEDEH